MTFQQWKEELNVYMRQSHLGMTLTEFPEMEVGMREAFTSGNSPGIFWESELIPMLEEMFGPLMSDFLNDEEAWDMG